MSKILLLEDDLSLINGLSFAFKKHGFELNIARTLKEADALWADGKYDLLVLDVSLPDGTGFEFCKRVRQISKVPIIFLTASDEETSIIMGLDIGGDDYITKPFSMRELLARVKANMRRVAAPAPAEEKNDSVLHVKDLTIDTDRHSVYRNGKEIELTEREYNILQLMASAPGRIFSREELMRQVWQYDYFGDLRTVDVAMRRFREKLEKKPAEPEYIMTRRGAGYYFAE